MVNAGTFPWIAAFRVGQSRLDVLNPDLRQRLDLRGYIDDRYRDALAEVPRLPGESGLEQRMREVSYLHLTRFVQALLDRKDRMSMAVGLEVRVPFCDHRLVEYVFNAPWSLKTFDGREKSLLRAATRDLLPRSIVERVKSPYPSTQDPAYEQMLRQQTANLLADETAPVRPLLDVANLRALIAEPVDPQRSIFTGPRGAMELVLQLNTWLSDYGVRVAA